MRDPDDVGEGPIRRRLAHELGDEARDSHHAERVAVGVRPRDESIADQPARARAVLDDDPLTVEGFQLVADRAREKVVRRTRGIGDDDADRLDGIGRGGGDCIAAHKSAPRNAAGAHNAARKVRADTNRRIPAAIMFHPEPLHDSARGGGQQATLVT